MTSNKFAPFDNNAKVLVSVLLWLGTVLCAGIAIGYFIAASDNDEIINENANLKLERDALRCEIEIYKTLHQEYANSGKVDDPNNYVCDNQALKKDGGE